MRVASNSIKINDKLHACNALYSPSLNHVAIYTAPDEHTVHALTQVN